jgi:hypothetical protein
MGFQGSQSLTPSMTECSRAKQKSNQWGIQLVTNTSGNFVWLEVFVLDG